MRVLRRIFVLTAGWVVLLALLSNSTAVAQAGSADDDEAPAEPATYGDAELIDALRTYGLLDEWIGPSPVSAPASLLLVSGNGSYEAQRQTFLDSLQTWAARTELVRNDVARIDAAQGNADRLRSVVTQVRDALVLDDRLATDSKTLVEIEDALTQLAAVEISALPAGPSEDPLALAEARLEDLQALAEVELLALNGVAPAFVSAGVGAFVGFEDLQSGLNDVDEFINRGRELVRPARETSERLVASAIAQIPRLHAARMVGSSDVGGLSVVTVDAYIRAAERSACSVDWALLAGVGQIESNHGRLGGASVSGSGQVSTTILGPLLDGGETEREIEESRQAIGYRWGVVVEAVRAKRTATQVLEGFVRGLAAASELADDEEIARDGALAVRGNGFAVVIDSDGGRLDGNDRWDRAVGPMQFIPETWSKWATDGNGDGVSDPHNLYDAAAAAGRFLCDLSATRGPSPSTFVLGYNSSTSYVRNVLSAADEFRAASLPDSG